MRRTPIAVVTALVLTASSLALASPAQAATICNPVTYNYEVRGAGAGIGNLLVRTNICMNGTTLASSTGAVTWVANPLGTAAGWVYTHTGTSRVTVGTNGASWLTTGTFKLCVPTQISPLCSYGEAFKVNYAGYAKSFVGPVVTPRFACTNSYCSNAMTFVYKGRS